MPAHLLTCRLLPRDLNTVLDIRDKKVAGKGNKIPMERGWELGPEPPLRIFAPGKPTGTNGAQTIKERVKHLEFGCIKAPFPASSVTRGGIGGTLPSPTPWKTWLCYFLFCLLYFYTFLDIFSNFFFQLSCLFLAMAFSKSHEMPGKAIQPLTRDSHSDRPHSQLSLLDAASWLVLGRRRQFLGDPACLGGDAASWAGLSSWEVQGKGEIPA